MVVLTAKRERMTDPDFYANAILSNLQGRRGAQQSADKHALKVWRG